MVRDRRVMLEWFESRDGNVDVPYAVVHFANLRKDWYVGDRPIEGDISWIRRLMGDAIVRKIELPADVTPEERAEIMRVFPEARIEQRWVDVQLNSSPIRQ